MPLLITPHAPAERVELDLTVEANALCVRTSRASGEALRVATAGEPSVIRVTALDACGNGVMSTAGDRFDVFLWDVKRGRRVNPRDPRLPRAHSNTYDRHGDDAMSGVCGRPCILELEGCWQPHSVHELTYSCDLAGRFDLWIQYTDPTGVHRPLEVASPSQLEVVPNRADARGSSLLPEGSFGQMLAASPTLTAGAELIVGVRVAVVAVPLPAGWAGLCGGADSAGVIVILCVLLGCVLGACLCWACGKAGRGGFENARLGIKLAAKCRHR